MLTTPRNLALGTSLDGLLPAEPNHWTDGELTDWRSFLQATGRWDAARQRRWDNMLHLRDTEGALERELLYRPRGGLPANVLATQPLSLLAQALLPECPALPQISHRIAEALSSLERGAKPNRAAMARLSAACSRLLNHRGVASVWTGAGDGGGIDLIGGLCLRWADGRFAIALGQRVLAEGGCTDRLVPGLRRLASLWRRLVRTALACRLQHGVPTFRRSLQAQLTFALPPCGSRGAGEMALCPDPAGGISPRRLQLLGPTHPLEEWSERYAVAGKLVAAAGGVGLLVRVEVDSVVAEERWPFDLVGTLVVTGPTLDAVIAQMDDAGRRNILAYAGSEPVCLEDPRASSFEVWQAGRHPMLRASFASLATAVDFERSNRERFL